ncbi:hypothetical protein Y032_0001g268 [Ancylostoma ceylanicum]|uniref:Uncharacterized protein n=1 Tax=Ancylostoma ceylanicum TaxID=53326 RepID=A0A016W3I8_9BILA|nr:hypothetical protein Y032_0001g268 [Ancylostoma ceylanicum]
MGLRYKIIAIFVISTPNNIPMQNLRGFCEIPYLQYTYRNCTRMELRYKMDTIFVFNTPENLPRRSLGENFHVEILGQN